MSYWFWSLDSSARSAVSLSVLVILLISIYAICSYINLKKDVAEQREVYRNIILNDKQEIKKLKKEKESLINEYKLLESDKYGS